MTGEYNIQMTFSKKTVLELIRNYWNIGDYVLLSGLAKVCEIEYHEDYGKAEKANV